MTNRYEEAFPAMKLMERKKEIKRSTYQSFKNSLLFSVIDLTPNIKIYTKSKQTQKSH